MRAESECEWYAVVEFLLIQIAGLHFELGALAGLHILHACECDANPLECFDSVRFSHRCTVPSGATDAISIVPSLLKSAWANAADPANPGGPAGAAKCVTPRLRWTACFPIRSESPRFSRSANVKGAAAVVDSASNLPAWFIATPTPFGVAKPIELAVIIDVGRLQLQGSGRDGIERRGFEFAAKFVPVQDRGVASVRHGEIGGLGIGNYAERNRGSGRARCEWKVRGVVAERVRAFVPEQRGLLAEQRDRRRNRDRSRDHGSGESALRKVGLHQLESAVGIAIQTRPRGCQGHKIEQSVWLSRCAGRHVGDIAKVFQTGICNRRAGAEIQANTSARPCQQVRRPIPIHIHHKQVRSGRVECTGRMLRSVNRTGAGFLEVSRSGGCACEGSYSSA